MKLGDRASVVPGSGPRGGSFLPERPRESGEFLHERPPVSSRRPSPESRAGGYSMVRILETPYCTLSWDRRHAIVRFTRTTLPYASIDVLEKEAEEIDRAFERTSKARLLVDLRAAAPRNDAEFETAMTRFRRKLFGGGDRMAVLVRTAVGALQVKRHMREDGFNAEVFHSEDEALAYLDMVQPDSSPRITALPPSMVRSPSLRTR